MLKLIHVFSHFNSEQMAAPQPSNAGKQFNLFIFSLDGSTKICQFWLGEARRFTVGQRSQPLYRSFSFGSFSIIFIIFP